MSETGTIEDQQVISPVLVERGESKMKKDCYCHKPLTVEFFKDMLFKLWSSEISGFSKEKIAATYMGRTEKFR